MKRLIPYMLPALASLSLLASLPFLQPYEAFRLLALAAGLAAWAVMLADSSQRSPTVQVTPLSAAILAFTLWCGFTFFWSVSPFATVIAWGALWLLSLWYLIFAVLPASVLQMGRALGGVVAVCAMMGAWALAQYFIWPQFLNENGNIRFPFADPNNYAGLLNLGIFMSLGLLFSGQNKRGCRVFLLIAAVVMLSALVLIGSRMAMACTVAGLGVFAWLARGGKEGPGPMGLFIGLFMAMVAILLASGLWGGGRLTALERVMELAALSDDKSLSARLDIWASTWELIARHMWQGAGLGTFFLLYPAVRAPSEIYSSGLMAHADPLQFWAEAGFPALALFYAILLMVLFRFYRYWKSSAADTSGRLLVAGLFCALLTLALHLHVTFHLYVPALLVATGLTLGAFARLTTLSTERSTALSFQTLASVIFLGLLAFAVVYQSCLFSEMHARQAAAALERGDLETFSRMVNQAGHEGFGLNPRPYVQAASIPIGLLQTSRGPAEEREALFLQADRLLDQALAASPVNAGAYYSKALLYGVMGRPEIDHFLDLTLKYDPQHRQARQLQQARGRAGVTTP
ncbi:MAG: O-antigen ligase family protein [Micavibrio aeruginosavorus]|uniref:O-antigen ligase family protein n=1 Tax=Micavibrio aeruginosavorus TaxID=349221 RepID=A0A7T5R3F8_9BACT|nr:MAG: O-antigen ligase family protein [Micavibrio aeruginosavorus]